MKPALLFGFGVYTGSAESLVQEIVDTIEKQGTLFQASLNVSKLALCNRSESFRATMRRFDILSADGMSIVWAGRLCGVKMQERVPGIDLMGRLLQLSVEHSLPVYLLGARTEVLDRAVTQMKRLYPSLRIAGMQHGYFDPDDEEAIADSINDSGAKILFVGMGSPRKEEFLIRHRQRLKVRFAMGVGGAFDVWAGDVRRASPLVQRCGMEWFHRMMQEPRRLMGRYARDNALFVLLVARQLLGRCWKDESDAQRAR